MNPIAIAHKTALALADIALKGNKSVEDIKKELLKLSKENLIEMLAHTLKAQKVTVESVARIILESDECQWLTYEEIADVVAHKMNSKTTHKGIADYASKRPEWNVKPRKSISERKAIIDELLRG